jgi:long-subunit fatty acid transport protein
MKQREKHPRAVAESSESGINMKQKIRWLIVLTVFICAQSGFGQFAEDAVNILDHLYGFGARSISMGTAFTAVADDYSAIYWNPAGLSQIKRMEFFGGISNLNYKNDATFYDKLTATDDNFTKLSSFGFVFPVPTFRGSLVFALGYQRVKEFDNVLRFEGLNPAQSGLNFDVDSATVAFFDENTRQQEVVNQDGSLNNWSFAGAIDVSPNVSVGLTINFWTGKSTYSFDFLQEDINDFYNVFPADFSDFNLSQKIISDYSAFQVKVGALIRASERMRLGFSIGLPMTFNVVEQFSSNNLLEFDNGDFFENTDYYFDNDGYTGGVVSEFEYDVYTPFQFGAGLSYSISDFLISGALEYIDLSQVKFEIPDDADLGSDYDALLDENDIIRDLYSGQLKLKIGGEYTISALDLKLRAGYMIEDAPQKNAPNDFNRKFYSAGLGFMVDEQFLIDVAYVLGEWQNTSEDAFTPGAVTEDISYQKLIFTTSFRF